MGFQNMLGNVVAAIVVVILTFAAFHIKMSSQEISVAATQFRGAKQGVLDAAAMIQRDFANIGANHPNFDLPIDSVFVTIDTVGTDRSFSFRGQTTRGATPNLITYAWVQYDTVHVDGGFTPVYQLTRYIDGVNTGSSAGITRFSLDFQRENGTTVTTVTDTRQIKVELRLVSSLGSDDLVGETRWTAVVRPIALRITTIT